MPEADKENYLTIDYERETGKITLNILDEGFHHSSIDITDAATACVIEKMFDDNELDSGGVLEIRKKIETPEKISIPVRRWNRESS